MRAEPECGFVFATTGAGYTELAIRAAGTLKAACPDYVIDLFTDENVSHPVFDQVIAVEKVWCRPKIEALRRSRFRKTVYLDADLFVIADISDIFTVLDRFDVAATHDQGRNTKRARRAWRNELPLAFPQFNSGVLGIRRSAETTALLVEWQREMLAGNFPQDQPLLRELLFYSDLRIATLAPEFNLMALDSARGWDSSFPSPRVIHKSGLRRHVKGSLPMINSLPELLGVPFYNHIVRLAKADNYISPDNSSEFVRSFCDEFPGLVLGTKRSVPLRRLLSKIRERLAAHWPRI